MGSRSEYLMGEAQFLKNIGFRIQYFRKKANLSQEQLAEKSDLSYSTISHIESTTCYTIPTTIAASKPPPKPTA